MTGNPTRVYVGIAGIGEEVMSLAESRYRGGFPVLISRRILTEDAMNKQITNVIELGKKLLSINCKLDDITPVVTDLDEAIRTMGEKGAGPVEAVNG